MGKEKQQVDAIPLCPTRANSFRAGPGWRRKRLPSNQKPPCRTPTRHIGAGLHHQPRGLVVDAAIRFDLAIEAAFLDGLADLTDFAKRFGDEILAAGRPD